jgi:hypothetical protein
MKFKIFNHEISVIKLKPEIHGAKTGWWYRFEGDSTDKVRLLYYNDLRNPLRCRKCQSEIRSGYVWDLYFVTPGLFNSKFDCVSCTTCFPNLQSILSYYEKKEFLNE